MRFETLFITSKKQKTALGFDSRACCMFRKCSPFGEKRRKGTRLESHLFSFAGDNDQE